MIYNSPALSRSVVPNFPSITSPWINRTTSQSLSFQLGLFHLCPALAVRLVNHCVLSLAFRLVVVLVLDLLRIVRTWTILYTLGSENLSTE